MVTFQIYVNLPEGKLKLVYVGCISSIYPLYLLLNCQWQPPSVPNTTSLSADNQRRGILWHHLQPVYGWKVHGYICSWVLGGPKHLCLRKSQKIAAQVSCKVLDASHIPNMICNDHDRWYVICAENRKSAWWHIPLNYWISMICPDFSYKQDPIIPLFQ